MYSQNDDDDEFYDNEEESSTEEYDESNDENSLSPSSTAEHSLSPSASIPDGSPMLSIDQAVLYPILDQDTPKSDHSDESEHKHLLQNKVRGKLKRTKSMKTSDGLSTLLTLFTTNCTMTEDQMTQIFHAELHELLSLNGVQTKSRHCAIIRNLEIYDGKRLCDLAKQVFENEKHASLVDYTTNNIIDVWHIAFMMVFFLVGKLQIAELLDKERLSTTNGVQQLLCEIYVQKKITTNLFDLLFFFMFTFDDCESRHAQITEHSWFRV